MKEEALTKEALQGLSLLENSQGLIRAVFLGIAMQYRALELQKQLLLTGNQPEDPKALQIAASLVILCALFGFQAQDERLASQALAAEDVPDLLEPRLNATVLLVALLRLFRLLSQHTGEPEKEI